MNRLNFADARHLTVRTGLGEEWNIIQQRVKHSRSEIINQLIKTRSTWTPPPPQFAPWVKWDIIEKRGHSAKKQASDRLRLDKQSLQEWWMKTMLETHHPIIERMTMFWHNHFTSSMDKINQPSLILKQNRLFRQHALGDFRTLLREVAHDPAMLIYLDCNVNVKDSNKEANENFARELMELYTIGEGNYSENDVRNIAKAFTGWTVDRKRNQFTFKTNKHDPSELTILGHTGNLTGNDVIDILLENPKTSVHIAKKFWREFITDKSPNMRTVNAWAEHFRRSNYKISELLKVVLSSEEFWAKENRGAKIKSPVELVVGTLRTLPIVAPIPKNTRTRGKRLTDLCHSLGQKLFVPPDPAGWPGGDSWIDSDTLTSRKNMLANFTNLESKNTLSNIPKISVAELSQWLFATDPTSALPEETVSNRLKIFTLLKDSAYQLT